MIKIPKQSGFTLVEVLVVIAVLSVMGVFMTDIFFRSLRASSKSQILSEMKKNGQVALGRLEKEIRSSDAIVCLSTDTVVIDSQGAYTRYRFVPASTNVNSNITYDQPSRDIANPCAAESPMAVNSPVLTNTDELNGVSIAIPSGSNYGFGRSQQAGFKDVVTIKFDVNPGAKVPAVISSQIDPLTLMTTVVLR